MTKPGRRTTATALMLAQRAFGVVALASALLWLQRCEHRSEYTPSTSIRAAALEHVDPALEGEVIAVRGPVAPAMSIADGEFLRPGDYVLVSRRVHRYVRMTRPGPTPAHATTVLEWEEQAAAGPFTSVDVAANPARIGARGFDGGQAGFAAVEGVAPSIDDVVEQYRGHLRPQDGAFYFGEATHARPNAGDIRVVLRVLRAGDVFTLIGRQRGDTIVSDATRDGAARLTATKRTLAELIADERAALKPYRWATRALVALVLVVAGGLILAPRRTGDALWAAVRRTISLSLWYAVLAGLAISSLVEGTDLLVAGSGIAGFLAFVWSMAMIPSGPTPLR